MIWPQEELDRVPRKRIINWPLLTMLGLWVGLAVYVYGRILGVF